MLPRLSLLLIGSELLDGRVEERNSQIMIARLVESGFMIEHTLTCDDQEGAIKECLGFLVPRSDAIIISGGLGPTTDDLTREAVAAYCGVTLYTDRHTSDRLKQWHSSRGRLMDDSNLKQALFPEGCTIIPNPTGTAAGFMVSLKQPNTGINCHVFAVPGVPSELEAMLQQSIVAKLKSLFERADITAPVTHTLRVFGLPEAVVGSRVAQTKPSQEINIAYCVRFPEVQVILRYAGQQPVLCAAVQCAREALGAEFIFSEDPDAGLDYVVHKLLLDKHLTIAVAESCTAGILGAMLTSHSGSSAYFLGGCLTYSNQSKQSCLKVSTASLEAHGAVSPVVAREMARGVRESFCSDLGVSITGIAGPEGGTSTKPAGTFFVGLDGIFGTQAYKFLFSSSRERVRTYAAWTALDLIRRTLLGFALPQTA